MVEVLLDDRRDHAEPISRLERYEGDASSPWLNLIVPDWENGLKRNDSEALQSGRSPQINRTLDAGLERQRHFLAGARGLVGGTDDFDDLPAVFAGFDRRQVVAYALSEVGHFLWKTVIPAFFKHRERPASRIRRLFDRITVARLAKRDQGASAQEVGVGQSSRSENLRAVVDSAGLGPAIFSDSK